MGRARPIGSAALARITGLSDRCRICEGVRLFGRSLAFAEKNREAEKQDSFDHDFWIPTVSMAADRQRAHAHSRALDHGNTPIVQCRFERRQIYQQKRKLSFGPAGGIAAKKDHRRLSPSPKRKDRTEIRVSGNDHAAFCGGAGENRLVVRSLQAALSHMNGIMAASPQALRHCGRERIINEKLQGAVSGNSRSRRASAA